MSVEAQPSGLALGSARASRRERWDSGAVSRRRQRFAGDALANAKSRSGWAMRSPAGIGSRPSFETGGPCVGAIGGCADMGENSVLGSCLACARGSQHDCIRPRCGRRRSEGWRLLWGGSGLVPGSETYVAERGVRSSDTFRRAPADGCFGSVPDLLATSGMVSQYEQNCR